jgi:medium-chain acyl-[acyl-carrier-protein] hydrolase
MFQRWAQPGVLPQAVEVCAVELPGRGAREQEPPLTRFSDLMLALTDALLLSLESVMNFKGNESSKE